MKSLQVLRSMIYSEISQNYQLIQLNLTVIDQLLSSFIEIYGGIGIS